MEEESIRERELFLQQANKAHLQSQVTIIRMDFDLPYQEEILSQRKFFEREISESMKREKMCQQELLQLHQVTPTKSRC